MIKATFYKNGDSYIGFSVIGHAGYENAGKDIVCAGVSTLTINTVNAIEALTENRIKIDVDDMGSIKLRFIGDSDEQGQLLVKALELGMTGIMNDYGKKYVEVHYKEV
ncbi:MAG: ribosomal-processing cysteine protease Prp [Wujia sp.]